MLPLRAVGWRASALRAEEAGRFRKVAGVSIVASRRSAFVVDNLTVHGQPGGLNKLNLNISTAG